MLGLYKIKKAFPWA